MGSFAIIFYANLIYIIGEVSMSVNKPGHSKPESQTSVQQAQDTPEHKEDADTPTVDAHAEENGAPEQPPVESMDPAESESPELVALREAEEKIAKYHDELLRAKAEVENIRRRSQEEVSKARKFGIESFAESLVPVIDSMEAAMAQPDQDATAWQEGMEATLRQLLSAFERNALKAVNPEPGERFDPHTHQAISSIPSTQPEGSIAQVLQKGYTIAERVLRPALVMVSTGENGADS